MTAALPKADAWLIPYCPNFFFLPSLCYHQIFKEWDNGSWDCPAYFSSVGLPLIPCYEVEHEEDANCWTCRGRYGKWDTGVSIRHTPGCVGFDGARDSFWLEALHCSQRVRDEVILLRAELSSPIDRGPISGPEPTWHSCFR